ncbi:hypothetical protein MKW94_005467 [Papaver nudicaule]|uniref:Prenyltransferase alpha-alpha toroid domain-containing protein n=1 Tax=Papaver nudicaule TaxID=74823 RepID=A0AA41RZU6_PAPNU|nr:hypothetical protein [Papaver nudicaule]
MGELAAEKHVQYIISIEKEKDSFEAVAMEHLRTTGAYGGLTTLEFFWGSLELWIKMRLSHGSCSANMNLIHNNITICQKVCFILLFPCTGGFAGNIGHDPHMLYTLSAVQVLALLDTIWMSDIAVLQSEGGLDTGDICVFCCVGALAITGFLNHIDKDLGWWLCERQVKFGGLNTSYFSIFHFPGFVSQELFSSITQVCYSWWVLSNLIMIDRVSTLKLNALVRFFHGIFHCQFGILATILHHCREQSTPIQPVDTNPIET